jgi:hypothetical protein
LQAEQEYRSQLATSNNPDNETRTVKGYQPTYDLWSTGGATGSSDADKAKWIKNW